MNNSTVNPEPIILRPCEPRDIPAIAGIYGYHVLHGLGSFEQEPPPCEEMERRRDAIVTAGHPYLVAERDGDVLGYAYTSAYRTRPAYRNTIENSVYIRRDCVGQGIGKTLLDHLIAACEARGFRQIVAVIGDSGNQASISLHRRAGFTMIGTIRSCGFKFGRWVDTVLMQRPLGRGDTTLPDSQRGPS